jgi:TATA-box binding protein (TBP) (component of TFIID and TFIIIB)
VLEFALYVYIYIYYGRGKIKIPKNTHIHSQMNVVIIDEKIPSVTITNVCSSFNTGLHFNLERIALELKSLGAYYNPARIATLMLTMQTSCIRGAKALVYHNGIVILSKAPSESISQLLSWEVATLFNNFNIPATVKNFAVTNIASKFELGFPVDIRALYNHLRICSSYNSTKFPALTIKPRVEGTKNPTINMFKSGNGVITGTSSRDQIVSTMKWLYPIATRFKISEDYDGSSNNTPFALSEIKLKDDRQQNWYKEKRFTSVENYPYNHNHDNGEEVDRNAPINMANEREEIDHIIEELTNDFIYDTEENVISQDK